MIENVEVIVLPREAVALINNPNPHLFYFMVGETKEPSETYWA
jgi:hypothetical protein